MRVWVGWGLGSMGANEAASASHDGDGSHGADSVRPVVKRDGRTLRRSHGNGGPPSTTINTVTNARPLSLSELRAVERYLKAMWRANRWFPEPDRV